MIDTVLQSARLAFVDVPSTDLKCLVALVCSDVFSCPAPPLPSGTLKRAYVVQVSETLPFLSSGFSQLQSDNSVYLFLIDYQFHSALKLFSKFLIIMFNFSVLKSLFPC